MALCGGFFHKMGYRVVYGRPGIPKKEKIIPLIMPIAHAEGIYNLSAQPKRPLHKTMCSGLLPSCYVRCAR